MARISLPSSMVALSTQAVDISFDLYAIQETCRHAGGEVEDVATELEMLSATLHRLKVEMAEDPFHYTDSFTQDLSEIVLELQLVFDEISECSMELQGFDPWSTGSIFRMFKEPKVRHLHKHLEALKTTLVVMRTVLHHGKEHGALPSSSLDEPQPHLMGEARAILVGALATNRDAVVDLHNIDATHFAAPGTDGPAPEAESSSSANPENSTHGSTTSASATQSIASPHSRNSSQSFSLPRRGRRLGVHTFLLNITGQHSPSILHREWLHPSRPSSPSGRLANGVAAPSRERIKDDQTFIMSHELVSSHFSSSSSSCPDSEPDEEAQHEAGGIMDSLVYMFGRPS